MSPVASPLTTTVAAWVPVRFNLLNNILHLVANECLELFIQPNPIADAGDDGTVCEYLCNQNCPPYDNGIYYDIVGNVQYEDSFEWTTDGDGLFIPNANVLEPDYMLGDGDIVDPDGEVELYLELD